mmetsp:Transcript_71225/g.112803  ORF Transcript_71225/g.112803 Transcript_71225/m.112803 type:complete len:93 (-) Transcript_71225:78-356(-)
MSSAELCMDRQSPCAREVCAGRGVTTLGAIGRLAEELLTGDTPQISTAPALVAIRTCEPWLDLDDFELPPPAIALDDDDAAAEANSRRSEQR